MESSVTARSPMCFCLILQVLGISLGLLHKEEIQDMGYGTEWIFFPDGEGVPYFVNLSMTGESLQTRAGIKGNEIEYRLYTRTVFDYIALDESGRWVYDGIDELSDKILLDKPIKVVTHGWMSSANKSFVMDIKNAYLRAQDVIVIGVDWSDTAMDVVYPAVARATEDIGMKVGQFLKAFCNLYDVPGDRLHLIGHSLGAHVMGIAASASDMNVGRITGLDPARPLFEVPVKSKALSLDQTDAQFVDIIHSCSGVLGFVKPIGHVDFYPNGGTPPQPGCGGSIFLIFESCSHSRSHIYFTESIESPTAFPACRSNGNWTDFLLKSKCEREIYMGDNVTRQASGKYYLNTNQQHPFGLAASP